MDADHRRILVRPHPDEQRDRDRLLHCGLFLSLVAATAIIGSLGLGLLMDYLSVRDGLIWFGVGTVALSIPVLIHVHRRLRVSGGAQRPNA